MDTLISVIDDVINHVKNEIQAGRRHVPIDKDVAEAFLASSPITPQNNAGNTEAKNLLSNTLQAQSKTTPSTLPANSNTNIEPSRIRENYKKFRGTDISPLFAFIGYEPSFDAEPEDKAFSGEQGALLDKMIAAMGLAEHEYIILNIFEEPAKMFTGPAISNQVDKLKEFLNRVDPKVIIVMGDEAASLLLKTKSPVANIHGVRNILFNKPCIPTYHPKNLLRFVAVKKAAWSDLKNALAIINRTPPPIRK
ncbi:MAG: hypothetical protein J6V41_02065 [Kiritimatiellae bacterium]|nr:hypothetical protein [Kiritimatiellia bacterium]